MVKLLIKKLRKSERGASIVEFALVLPILLLLVLGILEFGWLFNGWITLTGAAREGARLAVVGKENNEIEQAVRDHATIFQPGDVSITISIGNPGDETKVAVNGNLGLLVGFFPIADPFTLSAEATMRQEY